jgi:hypothetical protein
LDNHYDPFFIRLGKRKGYIDLGAEILGAERGLDKIAVEIKSFSGVSDVDEFEDALGQFLLYKLALTKKKPERILYLTMPRDFYNDLFDDAFFLEVLKIYQVHVIIYDYKNILIEQWIN